MQFIITIQFLLATFIITSEAFLTRSYAKPKNTFSTTARSLRKWNSKSEALATFRGLVLCLASSDENINPSDDGDTGMEDEDNYMGGQQWDEFPVADQLQDAEMIEAMRLERIIANDRWQSCLIRDKQGGEWTGNLSISTEGYIQLI